MRAYTEYGYIVVVYTTPTSLQSKRQLNDFSAVDEWLSFNCILYSCPDDGSQLLYLEVPYTYSLLANSTYNPVISEVT